MRVRPKDAPEGNGRGVPLLGLVGHPLDLRHPTRRAIPLGDQQPQELQMANLWDCELGIGKNDNASQRGKKMPNPSRDKKQGMYRCVLGGEGGVSVL